MKLFFASDIHGSAYYANELARLYAQEKADKLILLGDLINHGPRNPLPRDYSPPEVINILNSLRSHIIAIKGNCDSEVDSMVLKFHMMSDTALVHVDGINIYLVHGHSMQKIDHLLLSGDVVASGHTHIPKHENTDGITHLNPGSITMPKDGSPNTYMVYENRTFTIKDLKQNVYLEISI